MSNKFSLVPARAIADERFKKHPAALRVLNALGLYVNPDGWCYPSQATLAQQLGISRQAVAQHVQFLVQSGYVEVFYRKGQNGKPKNCVYHILPDLESDPQGYRHNSGLPEGLTPEMIQSESENPPRPGLEVADRQGQDLPFTASPALALPASAQGQNLLLPARSEIALTKTLESISSLDSEESLKEEGAGAALKANLPGGSLSPASFLKKPPQVDHLESPGSQSGGGHFPETTAEARKHPDIQMYVRVTGILPLVTNFKAVIGAIQYIREFCPTDESLAAYLAPLWKRWTASRRKDGKLYNRNNPAWLTEWAVSEINAEQAFPNEDEDHFLGGIRVIHNPSPALLAKAEYYVPDEI